MTDLNITYSQKVDPPKELSWRLDGVDPLKGAVEP